MDEKQTASVEFSPEESAAGFKEIGEHINTPMLPQHGVAALAMNMALKYWDLNTISDGVLYQQLKMEGRNIQIGVHLDSVIHVAKQIELHILNAPNRLSQEVYERLTAEFFEDVEAALEEAAPAESGAQGSERSDEGNPAPDEPS